MVLPLGMAIVGLKSLANPLVQPLWLPILYFTVQNLGTILNLWTNGDRNEDEKNLPGNLNPRPYDFIIGA